VSDEVDPRALADRAMGADPSEPADGDGPTPSPDDPSPDTTSSTSSGSPLSAFANGLLDAEADGPSIGELRGDYDLNRPGALTLRGVLRAAGAGGMPPLGEITLGGLLWGREKTSSTTSTNDQDDDAGDDSSAGLEVSGV